MATPAVEISRLEFAWPGCAVSLAIRQFRLDRGERVLLSGASGSGKSTLLNLIGGILQPRSGTVQVLGTPLQQLRPAARDSFRGEHVGFIFQMFNLIPYLTIRENVQLPLRFSRQRLLRLQDSSPESEANRLLHALGLEEPQLDRPVVTLSIGQQQRVAAARALIGRPDLILADEPTSALDADARGSFLELLLKECRQYGVAMLFVSHDRSLSRWFDRVLTLADLNQAR